MKAEWQLIETAPQDGTMIIGWCFDLWPIILRWHNGHWWVVGAAEPDYFEPTHWHPVPDLPHEAARLGGANSSHEIAD